MIYKLVSSSYDCSSAFYKVLIAWELMLEGSQIGNTETFYE
ncbi:hypothetical protein HF969_09555 [Facklamia miroungae]|nr:hypothetical protein [Facklamia miroungae]